MANGSISVAKLCRTIVETLRRALGRLGRCIQREPEKRIWVYSGGLVEQTCRGLRPAVACGFYCEAMTGGRVHRSRKADRVRPKRPPSFPCASQKWMRHDRDVNYVAISMERCYGRHQYPLSM
jgi:hypothetical protein